jgi:hypothetical protein
MQQYYENTENMAETRVQNKDSESCWGQSQDPLGRNYSDTG